MARELGDSAGLLNTLTSFDRSHADCAECPFGLGVISHSHDLAIAQGQDLAPSCARSVRRSPGEDDRDSGVRSAYIFQLPVGSALSSVEFDP